MPADPDPARSSVLCSVLCLILLILSAFCAAGESAMDCLSPAALRKEAEGGSKKAKALQKVLELREGVVSPLQFGLLLCGLPGGVLFALTVWQPLHTLFAALESAALKTILAWLAATLVYLLVFSVLGDIFPKRLVRHNGEAFAYKCAGLLKALACAASPFLSLSMLASSGLLRLCRIDPKAWDDAVTEEEILQMVDEGEEKGVLEETEKDMIANILDFNDTQASEIMTHRTDVTAVPDTAAIAEVVAVCVETGRSRVPVYKGDIDSVAGICYVKDLLRFIGSDVPENVKVTDVMRPAYFIPETKKCSSLFTEMTERKVQIAIVVDEYGGTAGLITLEDLVESIVGNIQDEYDNEEDEIRQVSETEFTVDGNASVDEISDLTGVELPEGDYDTLAGLVTEQLGRIPREDEHPAVEVSGLTITVLEMEDRRLAKLLIVKKPPENPEADPEGEEE